MIANEGLAWGCTAWFAVLAIASGVGALRAQSAADRLSYLAHVVMLAAMAIMPWPWFMAVPDAVWISLFAAMALGYAVLALRRPSLAVGPGAGHHARPVVAWYHVTMMLGMVWMVVLMGQMHAPGAAVDVAPAGVMLSAHVHGHGHGVQAVSALGPIDVPPLWNLPFWMTGLTFLVAAVFFIAAVRFLAQLRTAPTGTRRGEALPARTELVISAAIAAGMAASFFIMS